MRELMDAVAYCVRLPTVTEIMVAGSILSPCERDSVELWYDPTKAEPHARMTRVIIVRESTAAEYMSIPTLALGRHEVWMVGWPVMTGSRLSPPEPTIPPVQAGRAMDPDPDEATATVLEYRPLTPAEIRATTWGPTPRANVVAPSQG
jgi:hypothetical protein